MILHDKTRLIVRFLPIGIVEANKSMHMDKECIPCILNQVLRVCRYLELPQVTADAVFQAVMQRAASMDFHAFMAPQYSQVLYAIAQDMAGSTDPYQTLKIEHNRLIDSHSGHFREMIVTSPDPLACAAHYALLGNIIDYGSTHIFDINTLFDRTQLPAIRVSDYPQFKADLAHAKTLLYIADNAGEAVFDRLFIETITCNYRELKVTYAVRSAPAINDVTVQDAEHAGLATVAEILPSGSRLAGTVLNECTSQFRQLFAAADIVIAKGQGNFETMDEEKRPIYFMFKAKCAPVARHIGLPLGSLIFALRHTLTAV